MHHKFHTPSLLAARITPEHLSAVVPLVQTALWVVLAIVGVVLLRRELHALCAALVQRLAGGAAVEFGPFKLGELTEQVKNVRAEIADLSARVSNLFLNAMAGPMYENLRKLASDKFGPYEMNGGLERELFHLRDLGYIDVPYVRAIPSKGSNLSDHIRVTEAGREFVKLREETKTR